MSFSFCDTNTLSKIGLCANRCAIEKKNTNINPGSKKHFKGEGGVKAEMGSGRVIKCEHGEGLEGKSLCYVRVGRGEGLKVDRGLKTSRR